MRKVALLVAVGLIVALVAVSKGTNVEVTCGPSVTTPIGTEIVTGGQKGGMGLRDFINRPSSDAGLLRVMLQMRSFVRDVSHAFTNALNGRPESPGVRRWKSETKRKQQAAIASCCPPGIPQGDPSPTTPPQDTPPPFDPRTASLQKLTGAALAADALRRAGFPASEIPMFVAIAKHESTFGANLVGPTVDGGTMRGWWQLNDRYWAHEGWRDVYANAVKAKEVRDDSVKRGNGPFYPWSTRGAAQRDADQYRQFGDQQSPSGGGARIDVAPPGSAAPGPTYCPQAPAGGGAAGTVGTWNVLRTNSASNIAAGVRDLAAQADVFGLQELGSEAKRAAAANGAAGFVMSSDGTAVPILWRASKYDVVGQGRVQAFGAGQQVESRPADGSVVGPKFVVWAHLQDRATGRRLYVVNTHMLVGAWNTPGHRAPRREALYARQLQTVTDLVRRFKASGDAVVVTGDFNARSGAPLSAMGSLGLSPNGSGIDYVWGGAGVKRVLSAHGSDHRPVVVTLNPPTVAPKPDGPRNSQGLTPRAHQARTVTFQRWGCANRPAPCIRTIGGFSDRNIGGTNVKSDHASGNAIDIMVSAHTSKVLGDQIATYFVTNHQAAAVKYVIWNRRIWSPQRSSEGWRPYSGASAHTDHVHVSVLTGATA